MSRQSHNQKRISDNISYRIKEGIRNCRPVPLKLILPAEAFTGLNQRIKLRMKPILHLIYSDILKYIDNLQKLRKGL